MVIKAGFRSFLSVAVMGIPRQKDDILKAYVLYERSLGQTRVMQI